MADYVVCPSCKVRLTPHESQRGRTLGCPKCGKPIAIPPVPTAPRPLPRLPVAVDDAVSPASSVSPPAPADMSVAERPPHSPAATVAPLVTEVDGAFVAPEPDTPVAMQPVAPLDGLVITTSGGKPQPRQSAPPKPAPPSSQRPAWLLPAIAGLAGVALLAGAWLAFRGGDARSQRRGAARAGRKESDAGAAAQRGQVALPAATPAPPPTAAPADTAAWHPLPTDVPGVAVRFPAAPEARDPQGQRGANRLDGLAAAAGARAFSATADGLTFTATITPRELGDAPAEFHLERALANLDALHPGFDCVAIHHPAVAPADWRDAILDGAGRRRIVRLAQGADVAAALVVEGPADLRYDTPAVQGFFTSLVVPPAAPVAVP